MSPFRDHPAVVRRGPGGMFFSEWQMQIKEDGELEARHAAKFMAVTWSHPDQNPQPSLVSYDRIYYCSSGAHLVLVLPVLLFVGWYSARRENIRPSM